MHWLKGTVVLVLFALAPVALVGGAMAGVRHLEQLKRDCLARGARR